MKHQLYCTILIASAMFTFSIAKAQTPPALAAIRQQDIKTDIFEMAGDHFRGREAGTLDELKAAAWLADKARAAGLRPAGDDGT